MAYVITDLCTKCMNCPEVCPVSCIHPTEDDPDLDDYSQLFIDPEECTDCGSCSDQCPSDAIFPEEDVPADRSTAVQANRDHYA